MVRTHGILTALFLVGAGAVAQERIVHPPWTMTLGAAGPEELRFGEEALARRVSVTGFLPHWKGTRFSLAEAEREGLPDGVRLSRSVEGVQSARLAVSFAPLSCAFALETEAQAAGPTEFALEFPPEALSATPDLAWVVVDGARRQLSLAGTFPSLSVAREIVFELPSQTVRVGCDGFQLQDRRERGSGFYLVAVMHADGAGAVTHRKTVTIAVEPTPPEERAARMALLGQRAVTIRDVPVANAGFQQPELAPWSANPHATLDRSEKHGGDASVRVTIPAEQTDRTGIYLTQHVPATAGLLYQASAWIKAEGVQAATLGGMSATGADIILEFADAERKWLGPGSYAKGVYGSTGWQYVATEACRAPPGTGYAILFLSMRATGTGWFDDVALREIRQHVLLETPRHEAAIEDNTPAFAWALDAPGKATLEVAPSENFAAETTRTFESAAAPSLVLPQPLPPGRWFWRVTVPEVSATSAVWAFRQTVPETEDCTEPVILPDHRFVPGATDAVTVRCTDDRALAEVMVSLDGREGFLEAALAEGSVTLSPPGRWAPGLNRLRVVARDAAGNEARRTVYVTHGRDLPRKEWLSRGGVSLAGERRFLLGMYGVLTEHLPEMAAAGIHFVHNYTWDGPGTNETARQYLDACAAHGVQAFIGFHRAALRNHDLDFVAERVGALMDHPALLAWYLFDEPDLAHQYVAPERLREQYGLIKSLDPNHPVIVTVAQHHRMPDYHDTYDVYWSMDYGNTAHVARNFEFHRGKLDPETPLLSILHCYDRGQPADGPQAPDPARFQPDAAMLRANAFLAIAHGSSGLCWWWWGQGGTRYLTVAKVPWAWEALKQVFRQIISLEPVLTHPAPARMWIEKPADTETEVHLWEKALPDRTVVIAVNREPIPCRIAIAPAAPRQGTVRVLFEDRVLTVDQGTFADGFGPLAVHVYELR
ncbi:MAG: hypothetical protein JXR77_14780 [Lentisphaeria bacterium]|nr:hypothetical protein [Lentisphaeria bacterium]